MINGILNIDKPAGITSHDVVNQVRRIVKECQVGLPAEARRRRAKVGHTGTLDPFATGVLLVLLGPAARLAEYTHELPKTYETTITLGAASTTDDVTGVISDKKANNKKPTKNAVQAVVQQFIGSIWQVPPAYAAIKIKGKKLYEYARAGKLDKALAAAKQKTRAVTIHDITLLSYTYPEMRLRIVCGSGTYIRSLARDIGEKLGTGAYVRELRRTAIGPFTIQESVRLQDITPHTHTRHLLPPYQAVAHLPSVIINPEDIAALQQGKAIPWSKTLSAGAFIALLTKEKRLIGIGKFDPAASLLRSEKILAP